MAQALVQVLYCLYHAILDRTGRRSPNRQSVAQQREITKALTLLFQLASRFVG
jgi:hypothetical protein